MYINYINDAETTYLNSRHIADVIFGVDYYFNDVTTIKAVKVTLRMSNGDEHIIKDKLFPTEASSAYKVTKELYEKVNTEAINKIREIVENKVVSDE